MMFRIHFPLDRVSRFCADPSSIEQKKRSELARHLSEGCRRCWSAVADIAPGSVLALCDPVAEALRHVATPQSLATLRADHMAAVRDVRNRPLGFAFLLVEEAFALGWDASAPEVIEDDVLEVLDSVKPGRQEHPDYKDLRALARAYLSMVRIKRGELDPARAAWLMAEGHRHSGTGDERIRAAVLEARALLAAALDDPRHAEELLTTAMAFLRPDHALRRFELYGRLADVLIHAGNIHRVPAVLARANRLLATARASTEPIVRAQAICSRARLTAYLAARTAPYGELLRPALRWAADELEDAGDLFAKQTDVLTQLTRAEYLFRLYSFFDADRAVAIYDEARVRFYSDPYFMPTLEPGFRDLFVSPLSSEGPPVVANVDHKVPPFQDKLRGFT